MKPRLVGKEIVKILHIILLANKRNHSEIKMPHSLETQLFLMLIRFRIQTITVQLDKQEMATEVIIAA
jgi:hypothetical protein